MKNKFIKFCLDQKFQQNEIGESAYNFQKDFDNKEKVQIGVNKFFSENIPYKNIQKIDNEAVKQQIKNLKKIKRTRDNNLVKICLSELENGAKGNKNIIPLIIEAAKVNASLGEISDTLRNVFDEYKE